VEVSNSKDIEEIDPDDASKPKASVAEDKSEMVPSKQSTQYKHHGIGNTLMKVRRGVIKYCDNVNSQILTFFFFFL
jgi:hypothetical protein